MAKITFHSAQFAKLVCQLQLTFCTLETCYITPKQSCSYTYYIIIMMFCCAMIVIFLNFYFM